MGQVNLPVGLVAGAASGVWEPSYWAGLAVNLSKQPLPQKYQVWPACTVVAAALAGSTFMPQTGSVLRMGSAGVRTAVEMVGSGMCVR